MNKKDLEYFKDRLEKEKKILEDELLTVSRVDPEHIQERDATSGEIEVDSADENEVADKFEEIEENQMILNQLAPQLKDVEFALKRIKDGTYGICEISGEPIEKDRLEASPSAKTCVKHMKR